MTEPEQGRTGRDVVELTVIAPCLNEELNLPELSERILSVFDRGGFRGELILVDDGSTDGTAAGIRALESRHPGVVRGVFHPKNRGIAAAWRSGTAAASGRLVSIIDADLQYQPEDLLRLRHAYYERSVDIVQGWRSPVGRAKDQRYALSRGFNVLLNGIFSMSLKDNKSGFIVCPRAVMLDLLEHERKYLFWQSFIMVAAHAKGYSYQEIETVFAPRRHGESFIDKAALRASLRSFSDLGKAILEYRLTAPPADVAANFLRHHPPAPPPGRTPRPALARGRSTIPRDVRHYHDTLDATQWLSPEDTRELQDEKLRKLVRHCYRTVPFYRARMGELGVRPEDIGGQADLSRLPVLERADVARHLHFDMMSELGDNARLRRITTSGGWGRPFAFYVDQVALEMRWAASLRAAEWMGHRPGDPALVLVDGARRASDDSTRTTVARALRAGAAVDIGDFDQEATSRIAGALASAHPILVAGDAEVMEILARDLAAPIGVGAVATAGQTLGADARAAIEARLSTRVFDQYTAAEFGTIAHECEEHAGHHVVAESCIVEVLRPDGAPAAPGELGDVVITGLDAYAMPFLRYRIGDRAVALDRGEACRCGRGSPRLGALRGRPPLVVRGDAGRRVPASFFFDAFKEQDQVRRFSVRQADDGVVHVRVAPADRFSRSVLDEPRAALVRRLGAAAAVEIEVVSEAELSRQEDQNGASHLPAPRVTSS